MHDIIKVKILEIIRQSAITLPAWFGSVLRRSATYFVAVNPIPILPKTTNIFMVERTIPNSPYTSLPSSLAIKMKAKRFSNRKITVPATDQHTPVVKRDAISDDSILFHFAVIYSLGFLDNVEYIIAICYIFVRLLSYPQYVFLIIPFLTINRQS